MKINEVIWFLKFYYVLKCKFLIHVNIFFDNYEGGYNFLYEIEIVLGNEVFGMIIY